MRRPTTTPAARGGAGSLGSAQPVAVDGCAAAEGPPAAAADVDAEDRAMRQRMVTDYGYGLPQQQPPQPAVQWPPPQPPPTPPYSQGFRARAHLSGRLQSEQQSGRTGRSLATPKRPAFGNCRMRSR